MYVCKWHISAHTIRHMSLLIVFAWMWNIQTMHICTEMYESPYIQGCMYVIIICWILGNMYGSITLDIGAYLSYIYILVLVCVCVYSYFLHSAIKKASTESNREAFQFRWHTFHLVALVWTGSFNTSCRESLDVQDRTLSLSRARLGLSRTRSGLDRKRVAL